MSQLAICSAVTGTPSFGPSGARPDCAVAHEIQPNATQLATNMRAAAWSHVRIADLPRFADLPALDRVVVITIVRAARGHERCARRLHGSALVRGSARQHARAPVPAP